MSKKVLLFVLKSINNVGEDILEETTRHLIQNVSENAIVSTGQLWPEPSFLKKKYRVDWYLGAIFFRIAIRFKGNLQYKIKNWAYRTKFYRYFKFCITNTDIVIYPVGMLKYSTQNFSYVFYLINQLAAKYNKPVLMSAMSPQTKDAGDWRYHQLVKAVNMPSVKMITTRDGEYGMEIIYSDYLKRKIHCEYVGDPALWIPETYKVKCPKYINSCTTCVGINVIRKGIFDDYNRSFTDKELCSIYVELIKLIEEKGWNWFVFCNGIESDWEALRELQRIIGFSEKHVMQQFSSAKDFVTKIAGFDAVFGARLHSCITSVSLGVPVVGFIWDNKIKYFAETMKIRQFFFEPKNMTASNIIQALEQAMKYKYDINNIAFYKNKTRESLRLFLEESF